MQKRARNKPGRGQQPHVTAIDEKPYVKHIDEVAVEPETKTLTETDVTFDIDEDHEEVGSDLNIVTETGNEDETTIPSTNDDAEPTADDSTVDSDEDIIPENEDYRYLDQVQVVDPKHQARLKEDFGWIGDLQIEDVNGQRTIRDPQGNYVISDTEMTETAFVSRWLDQFALGYVGKANYFDATTWGKLTQGHQHGVVVKSDAGEPIFVIPPLSRAQFTPMEQVVLDMAHKSYANASAAEDHGQSVRAQEIITGATDMIKQYVSDESITVTDLIPDWFYEKYNVIPYVKRSMVYCRDIYGLNPAHQADWDMAEGVFTTIHKRQALSEFQLQFMDFLTNSEFKVPEYEIVEDLGNPQPRGQYNSADEDPFEN